MNRNKVKISNPDPYYHDIILEELRKTTNNLGEDTQSLVVNSNQSPPKCKTESLPAWKPSQ